MKKEVFLKGVKDGLPIGLGYLSVSFAFGMMAVESGLPVWVALLISMTNMTSAGQVAGVSLITGGGTYIELFVTTVVINLRYALMSLSLSQKLDEKMSRLTRTLLPFGNTDEIFAVAMQSKGAVTGIYFAGLLLLPYLGWSIGTLLGGTMMSLLPPIIRNALGLALYGMFLAIIIPVARQKKSIAFTVIFAALLSIAFYYIPALSVLSGGWSIIICSVISASAAAILHPIKDAQEDE